MSSSNTQQRPSLTLNQSQLDSLQQFSLLDALFGRRSRRFGVGMEIPDGPLAYQSQQPAQALSRLERLLLVTIGAGISGWHFGIPYTESATPGLGCNYPVRPAGRTYPSGAGVYGSELLITDDSGTYITRFRDLDPAHILELQSAEDLPRLLSWLEQHIIRLSDKRLDLPASYPHIVGHNRWVANRPGTTLFIPVIDQADSLLNQLAMRAGEGIPAADPVTGRLLGNPTSLLRKGILHADRALALDELEQHSRNSTVAEASIASYNIHLALQALGLGGWLFSGLNIHSLLGGKAKEGIQGFGFRFTHQPHFRQPNPVGLDGVFEPLVPPYVSSMHEAVQRFAERKFGARGNFSADRPGPFKDNAAVKTATERWSQEMTEYIASVAQDIYDSYGKFPGTIPTVCIATYTQAHHIDHGFYDKFFGEDAYLSTHRDHQRIWHE